MLSKRYRVFVLLILLLAAARLYADGCFVWNKGADLTEPSQKAIIYFEGGKEVLILQVKYEGPAEEFAWIVPLPAKPEVAAIDADKSPFAEISLYTQIRRRWGFKGRDTAREQAVTVLERKIVGVYDIAVLAASEAGALTDWLNDNGYAFPKERNDVLEHYTQKKWVYVAMRIDRKALESNEVKKLKTGELQPIRFAFSAKEVVYPLKISSVNSGQTEVLLYLLSDAPMVAKSEHKRPGLSIEQNICRFPRYQDPEYGTFRKVRGEELPLTWEALGVPKNKELSLCKYRSVYRVEEMTDDLLFEPFEPKPYWQGQLRKLEAKEGYRWLRPGALSVLACYDADLLQKLAREGKEMRELAALNPRITEELLWELAWDNEDSVRSNVARNLKTPVEILRELAKDKDKRVRGQVALNPNTPADVFRDLAEDKESAIREALLQNHNISSEVLRKLAVSKDSRVRYLVAFWTGSVDLLHKLAKDESPEVRRGVGHNRNTPKELLRELAFDESLEVRFAVASNVNSPVGILSRLARDKTAYVREMVALNDKTPVKVLVELSADKDEDVRTSVAKNSRTPSHILSELANDSSSEVRSYAAANAQTDPQVLARLADDEHVNVRNNVSSNRRTATDTLLILAEDKDAHVRMGAASNPNTPVEALWKLAKDSDEFVRTMVALNPNTQEDVLRALAKDNDSYVSELANSALKERGH